MIEIDGFLPEAKELAVRAGARLRELFNTPLVRERKADRSLVTNADRESDELLRSGLRKAFPSHAVLSEEAVLEGPVSDYVWLVDPLDGTKAFAEGRPGFCVMLGLLWKEMPVVGVVYEPLEDHLTWAAKGGGCFHSQGGEARRVRVSDRSDLSRMPVVTSTGLTPAMEEHLRKNFSGPLLEPINSVGVKIGYLVRQAADFYVNHHLVHMWDTCAPGVILEEAGGVMTLWDGTPLTYTVSGPSRHPGPTAASNGRRHPEFLKILSTFPSRP
ncbi:MAG TPA: inositol monophosphatase family protein [Elusimicrobiota bacterium]|nr:inositol monophosphatase family protein [Elusimicrobiota bacterium]